MTDAINGAGSDYPSEAHDTYYKVVGTFMLR